MSSAFSCMVDLAGRGADINAMWHGWIELSEKKGYLRNEEGWRRYLFRVSEAETFPKLKKQIGKNFSPMPQPPPEFVTWWQRHPESEGGPNARIAYNSATYHNQWKDAHNPPVCAA